MHTWSTQTVHSARYTNPSGHGLFSFELHRRAALQLLRDSGAARAAALRKLPLIRGNVRGELGARWMDEWDRLLHTGTDTEILDTILGHGEWADDMRQVSPLVFALTGADRTQALSTVRSLREARAA
ncbi:MAG: hypothetical protein ABF811_06240 [Pseudoclavibacter sp.]|jgi:hypothetical protein